MKPGIKKKIRASAVYEHVNNLIVYGMQKGGFQGDQINNLVFIGLSYLLIPTIHFFPLLKYSDVFILSEIVNSCEIIIKKKVGKRGFEQVFLLLSKVIYYELVNVIITNDSLLNGTNEFDGFKDFNPYHVEISRLEVLEDAINLLEYNFLKNKSFVRKLRKCIGHYVNRMKSMSISISRDMENHLIFVRKGDVKTKFFCNCVRRMLGRMYGYKLSWKISNINMNENLIPKGFKVLLEKGLSFSPKDSVLMKLKGMYLLNSEVLIESESIFINISKNLMNMSGNVIQEISFKWFEQAAEHCLWGSTQIPGMYFAAANSLKLLQNKIKQLNKTSQMLVASKLNMTIKDMDTIVKQLLEKVVKAQKMSLKEFKNLSSKLVKPEQVWLPIDEFVNMHYENEIEKKKEKKFQKLRKKVNFEHFFERKRCKCCGNCRGNLIRFGKSKSLYCNVICYKKRQERKKEIKRKK